MPTPQQTLVVALLVLLPTLSGCATSRRQLGADGTQQVLSILGPDHAAARIGFDSEVAAYQELAEKSLTYRAATIKLASRLKERIEQDQPLSGAELDTLNQGIVAHLRLRQELYAVAQSHERLLDESAENLALLGIAPETRLKGVMLSLSAALVLYDNYLLAISLFDADDKLRRAVNHRDSGYEIGYAELAKVTLEYNSVSNRNRVRGAITFYEREIGKVDPSFFTDPQVTYLQLLITQSPSYSMTKKVSPLSELGRKLDFLGTATGDTVVSLGNEGMNLFSMLFGNAVGLIETRTGKLYKHPEVAGALKKKLHAGDILLEKTPFRLTDKLIPGFWGHAAIWLGTEAELRELGIWDDPLVARYQEEIRQGRLVVEALRTGVELNTLEHFLNIDDLGVLRKEGMDRQELGKLVLLALRQVGKGYDFNFDVETTDRIVCSELIYQVYTGIDWPTQKALGRATISPDNVASKALDGGPLQLVTFYHDGKPVEQNPLELVALLMRNR